MRTLQGSLWPIHGRIRGGVATTTRKNILTMTRHVLTTPSIAPQYHNNTPLLPAQKPRSLGSRHLGTFKRLHSLASKCVLPAAPPASDPRSLDRTHFGTFKGQNSQNVYSQPFPPSKPKMCTFSCSPLQSPDPLGVRILATCNSPSFPVLRL